MQGLGNVILVVESENLEQPLTPAAIRSLADPEQGTGFDQLMLLTKADGIEAFDYSCQIYNRDGSAAEQCGNGMRCVARYLSERQGYGSRLIKIGVGNAVTTVCWDGQEAEATLAAPNFHPEAIPFNPDAVSATGLLAPRYQIAWQGKPIYFDVVNVGNPHAVVSLEKTQLSDAEIEAVAPILAAHPSFLEGVNVGFARQHSRKHIQLRVYERGAGWTQACGSGAAAAVSVGRAQGILDNIVSVTQAGGTLHVACDALNSLIVLRGAADWVR